MMMNRVLKGIFVLCVGWFISACGVTPQEYDGEAPVMDMKTYFNGELEAWGLFRNHTGKVVRRFHVAMTGEWNGNQGVLDEFFTYADGSKQRRTWKLNRIDEHNYTGTADDVIGEAKGVAYGHALRWQYMLALEVDDDVYHVHFDDWMYLIDENTMINRSVMSKFGINLGEVILVFRKHSGKPSVDNTRGNFNMPNISRIAFNSSAII
ncbi:DUF3833 domain-containing protein [Kaarinaea lacus]